MPLLQNNIDNIKTKGFINALTGPIERNDLNTVKQHIGAIPPEDIKMYKNLSLKLLVLSMGHIGLTPQSVNMFGGIKVQGKNIIDAKKLIEDAKKIEAAGAFALVLECIPSRLADRKYLYQLLESVLVVAVTGKF